jgi:hypothetical protein
MDCASPLPLGFLVDDMIFEGTTRTPRWRSMIPGKVFSFIMATADKGVAWRDLTTPEVAATCLANLACSRSSALLAARLSAVDGSC